MTASAPASRILHGRSSRERLLIASYGARPQAAATSQATRTTLHAVSSRPVTGAGSTEHRVRQADKPAGAATAAADPVFQEVPSLSYSARKGSRLRTAICGVFARDALRYDVRHDVDACHIVAVVRCGCRRRPRRARVPAGSAHERPARARAASRDARSRLQSPGSRRGDDAAGGCRRRRSDRVAAGDRAAPGRASVPVRAARPTSRSTTSSHAH